MVLRDGAGFLYPTCSFSLPAYRQALGKMQRCLEHQQESLSELTATPSSQLRFVEDAWDQVRELGMECSTLCDAAGTAFACLASLFHLTNTRTL